MRFVGLLMVFLGLYAGIRFGILGKNPLSLSTVEATGSNSPGTPGAGSGFTGTEQGGPEGSGPFGLPSLTYQTFQSGWLSADQRIFAGISSFLGVAGEMNYGLPNGTQTGVYLPRNTKGWQIVKTISDPCAWGIMIVRDLDTGGYMAFLHLSKFNYQGGPQPVAGGSQIGVSGWPIGAACAVGGQAGPSNSHLAVVYDPLTRKYVPGAP